jgi:ankyrin repeat protein
MPSRRAGDRAAVRTLLTGNTVNGSEANGMTALHWAVRSDDLDTVSLLLRAGANANAANRYGITPLSLAATNGNAATTRALLSAGANPGTPGPDGETALMTAARAGSADVVNALIEKGANVNETEAWQGQAALMWAAAENHAAAIKVLTAHGAEMDARSKELSFPKYRYETNGMAVFQLPKGRTALMYAAPECEGCRRGACGTSTRISAPRPNRKGRRRCRSRSSTSTTTSRTRCSTADPNVIDSTGMTALYAAVDMRAPANLLTRPEPKLRDSLDALATTRTPST